MVVFGGCKTTEASVFERDTVYVSKVNTDTLYISKVDSAYVHDSVFIKESGDTVYYSKWHTAYKYKTDTIYHIVYNTDTVYVSNDSNIEVKVQPTLWEKVQITLKGICLIIIIGVAIYLLAKFIFK